MGRPISFLEVFKAPELDFEGPAVSAQFANMILFDLIFTTFLLTKLISINAKFLDMSLIQ